MSGPSPTVPPGWYRAEGDPPGTNRYWNGSAWEGKPRRVPGVVTSDSFPLADLPERLVARAIDLVLWLLLIAVIRLLAGALSVTGFGWPIGFLAVSVYEAYLVAARGSTVGKLARGLAVVKADGTPADLASAVRRVLPLLVMAVASIVPAVGVVVLAILVVMSLVGMLMVYADAASQTVWDKLARTLVVTR
jgi:uncharacterized RDD family membrane protein YckC